jgi:L-amino acid N-acyltransferase YncA
MASATEGGGQAGVGQAPQGLSIRRAVAGDSKDVWRWRNDKATRQMSVTTARVAWETHRLWYERLLLDESRYLYVGCDDSLGKIGMCRFDLAVRDNVADVSINLDPRHRGKGLSVRLLSAAIATFPEAGNVDLLATVRTANIASIRCFTATGFVLENQDGEYQHYRRRRAASLDAR